MRSPFRLLSDDNSPAYPGGWSANNDNVRIASVSGPTHLRSAPTERNRLLLDTTSLVAGRREAPAARLALRRGRRRIVVERDAQVALDVLRCDPGLFNHEA